MPKYLIKSFFNFSSSKKSIKIYLFLIFNAFGNITIPQHYSFFASISLRFNFSNISLYLFLIVTSVIPATSAISFCVFCIPCFTHAKYIAAAATPAGPLPAVISDSFALLTISIAVDITSGGKFNNDENLCTYSVTSIGCILSLMPVISVYMFFPILFMYI